MVAERKVSVTYNGGKPAPHGALIEPSGQLSSDPRTLYWPIEGINFRNSANGEGVLRPFGDHKGSGVAIMCELLAECLARGDASGPILGGKRGRIANGVLSIYLSPARFGTSGFLDAVFEYASYVKGSRPAEADGEVLIPGEP